MASIIITMNRVEISKNGRPYRWYEVTRSSWNRLLFLLKKHNSEPMLNCIRFRGVEATASHSHDIRFYLDV